VVLCDDKGIRIEHGQAQCDALASTMVLLEGLSSYCQLEILEKNQLQDFFCVNFWSATLQAEQNLGLECASTSIEVTPHQL
jgi:hypothetical protein